MNNDDQRISIFGIVVWFIASLFFLYEFFLRTFIGSIANEVIPALKLTAEEFSLLGAAYYFTYALMQLPVGILVDRFGVKKLLIFATLICAVGTFSFAYSFHFYIAIIARMLTGFGSSFAFVSLLVIALNWFPQKNFGFFAGASQFVGTAGPLLAGGPLVLLLQEVHDDWRIILSLVGSFGAVLTILVFLIVRDQPRRTTKKRIYFLSRDISLKLQIQQLIRNPQVWFVALYSASVYISAAVLGAIWGTDYLESRGLSQSSAAFIASLIWLGYAVGCPLIGSISDRIRRRKSPMLFCALLSIGIMLAIILIPTNAESIFTVLFILLGVAGAGQNIGFVIISEHVETNLHATALGFNNAMIMFFGAVIPPVMSLFIRMPASTTQITATHLLPTDFMMAFVLLPALNLAAYFIVQFFVKETFCRPQKVPLLLKP